MDIFRISLCVGLVVLLWRFELRGVRPVRDFFFWGVDYPVHFGLTAVLILVIWGLLGSSFGLQGLFLDEDPLTQLLLGATVMLLFAATHNLENVLAAAAAGVTDVGAVAWAAPGSTPMIALTMSVTLLTTKSIPTTSATRAPGPTPTRCVKRAWTRLVPAWKRSYSDPIQSRVQKRPRVPAAFSLMGSN